MQIEKLRKESNGISGVSNDVVKSLLKDYVADLNNCSKRYIYRFFDNVACGDTVMYPGESDAMVITPIEGCSVGMTISMDSNQYGQVDPYVSGAAAVAEGA